MESFPFLSFTREGKKLGIRKLKEIETVSFDNQVSLREYLHRLIETDKENAYFFVCTLKGDGTGWTQKPFHVNEYEKALDYITKNSHKRVFLPTVLFDSRERAEMTFDEAKFIIIDCDLYNSEKYKDYPVEKVFEIIRKRHFDNNRLPMINGYFQSGGGLYLVYAVKDATGKDGLKKRNDIVDRLSGALDEFEVDAKSLDAPHVFGAPESTNYKYKEKPIVKAFFTDELPEYTIDELNNAVPKLWESFQDVFDIEIAKPKKPKDKSKEKKNTESKAKKSAIEKKQKEKAEQNYQDNVIYPPQLKERTYSYDMIQNMFKLAELRNFDVEGYREMLLFVVRNYYHGMHAKRFHDGDETLFEESYQLALQLNRKFKEPLDTYEVRTSTLNVKKVYRFKLPKLNKWFKITLDEQAKLKVKTKKAKNHKSKLQMRELNGIEAKNGHDEKRKRIVSYFLKYPEASNSQASRDLSIHRNTIIKHRPDWI